MWDRAKASERMNKQSSLVRVESERSFLIVHFGVHVCVCVSRACFSNDIVACSRTPGNQFSQICSSFAHFKLSSFCLPFVYSIFLFLFLFLCGARLNRTGLNWFKLSYTMRTCLHALLNIQNNLACNCGKSVLSIQCDTVTVYGVQSNGFGNSKQPNIYFSN